MLEILGLIAVGFWSEEIQICISKVMPLNLCENYITIPLKFYKFWMINEIKLVSCVH